MNYQELLKQNKFKFLLAALILIIPLEILSFFSLHLPLLIELVIFSSIIFFFGKNVFIGGIQSLIRFKFADINLLMTIATLGAFYLHEFEEAAIIVVLFAIGNALEDFGMEKSQNALEKLVEKTPKTAQIKDQDEKTPIEQIQIGEIIIVKPGDQIPLDGEVVKGESLIDEAVITGEPLPKNKRIGDFVYAGTINTQGYLEIRVTKTAKDSTLSKIIDLTYKAAEKKSMSQKFIEKFAGIYTPIVVVIAVLLVLIPVFVFHQPFDKALSQAITLLVIACPCALVISTPVAIFSAIGNATQKGVIIKGGRFLEEIGKVRAIAFDKTRTLTKGIPVVSDVITFNGFTRTELLACIAGMEAFSEHPIAKSIEEQAKKENATPHEFADFKAIAGKGVTGSCAICVDKHHCLGSMQFITQEHKVAQKVLDQAEELEKMGKTIIVVSDDKQVEGIIGVTDELRSESKQMIDSLKRLKVIPIILTGDNKTAAQFVASQLGIHEVRAELLPENKVTEITQLLSKYKGVAMVGDGVNDAPALASSSVGIVMGAMGSDVAIENADIALMNDNLEMVPYLIGLGKKTVGKIRFNISTALIVKALFLTLATVGLSNLAFAIFADVGVTLLVVVNSLGLYGYSEKSVKIKN